MPYYSVAKGRNAGVYHSWDECKQNVNGYSGAVFKKFSSEGEARSFMNNNGGSSGSGYSSGSGGYNSSRSGYGGGSYSGSGGSYKSLESSGSYKSLGSGGSYKSSRSGYGSSGSGSSNSGNGSGYGSSGYGSLGYGSSGYGGSSKSKSTRIYTDGASRGNGRTNTPEAGYGVYFGPNDPRNVGRAMSEVDDVKANVPTNQRAELTAIRHALQHIDSQPDSQPYTIVTDSQYSQKALTEWSNNWQKNNWRTSNGAPVANQDLIKENLSLMNKINSRNGQNSVQFEHVRGHNGDPGNEGADALANSGADKLRFY